MSAAPEWTIVTYDETGSNPVGRFIESLHPKAQVSLAWAIEQLRVRNVLAQEPLVRHVEGKIWELRREIDTNSYRILYFAAVGRRFVLLHGFQKKTRKAPAGEMKTVWRRLEDFQRLERSQT